MDEHTVEAAFKGRRLLPLAALRELRLVNVKLNDSYAHILADDLRHTSVELLDLSENEITSQGAAALARLLKDYQSPISTLILSKNEIGSIGAESLASAISTTRVLTKVLLDGNEIGCRGAKALASAIANVDKLTLDLRNNFVHDEGAMCFVDVLHACVSSETNNIILDLTGNLITSVTGAVLRDTQGATMLHHGVCLRQNVDIPWDQLAFSQPAGSEATPHGYWGQHRIVLNPFSMDEQYCCSLWILRQNLQHPNVLRVYGTSLEQRGQSHYHYLVTEALSGSSLMMLLQEKSIPWFERESIALGITRGLAYLHSKKIPHGALTSSNIVVSDDYLGKLQLPLPLLRKAPRAIEMSQRQGKQADIQSLGTIIWELCITSVSCNELPPYLIKIMKYCCTQKASERPAAEAVVRFLIEEPYWIIRRVFPHGVSSLFLRDSNVVRRDIAPLYTLKQHPRASEIFRRLITEAKLDDDNTAWRVHLLRRPIDVRYSDITESQRESPERLLCDESLMTCSNGVIKLYSSP